MTKYLKFIRNNTDNRIGDSYVVKAGDYKGLLLIYMATKNDSHGFLSIPLQKNHWIPEEKFDFDKSEHIIEFVEHLPKYVIEVAETKFQENESEMLRSTN